VDQHRTARRQPGQLVESVFGVRAAVAHRQRGVDRGSGGPRDAAPLLPLDQLESGRLRLGRPDHRPIRLAKSAAEPAAAFKPSATAADSDPGNAAAECARDTLCCRRRYGRPANAANRRGGGARRDLGVPLPSPRTLQRRLRRPARERDGGRRGANPAHGARARYGAHPAGAQHPLGCQCAHRLAAAEHNRRRSDHLARRRHAHPVSQRHGKRVLLSAAGAALAAS